MSSDKWVLHLISHTHWDREWYMSFEKYRIRFVKLMDHLLTLLQEREDYHSFTMDGQTVVIGDYLEIRPEKGNEISELVSQGRLLVGPWYSQPNEFMASGEALIRNLILGYKESKTYGAVMTVCYLPDAFGHISQLPQIIKGFGMEDVVVWRGLPRGSDTVFSWTGADGSECLVFNIYRGYGNAVSLPLNLESYTEYMDQIPIHRPGLVERVKSEVSNLGPRATSPHLLFLNGVDHSFAQANLPEVIAQINENVEGVLAVHSSLPKYISAVRQHHNKHGIAYQEAAGELRDSSESPILPGSQSTRVKVKIRNRQTENLLEKWMEPFAAIAWLLGDKHPTSLMWKAWEYLLQNHAHDSMACSSVDTTYDHVLTRFDQAYDLGEEIVDESLQQISSLVEQDPKAKAVVMVFNPLNWDRDEVVTTTLDIPVAWSVRRPALYYDGEEIPLVVHRKKEQFTRKFNPRTGHPTPYLIHRYLVSFAPGKVPCNGYKALQLISADRPAAKFTGLATATNTMENEYLVVKINPNGTFDLTDKGSSTYYEGLHLFEDGGEAGHGFDYHKPLRDQIVYSTGGKAQVTLVENNPLRAAYRIKTQLEVPKCLSEDRQTRVEDLIPLEITSVILLEKGSRRVDVETRIMNTAKDHRLRVIFPTGIRATHSYAEQPFDVVARDIKLPDLNADYCEGPAAIHPQLSFVDVNDGNIGFMVANEGLYEYEVIDDDDRSIALTLLRCTDRLGDAPGDNIIPGAQCLGEHVFRYSVIPHQGGWEAAYKQAYGFNFPLKSMIQRSLEEELLPDYQLTLNVDRLPQSHAFIHVDPDDAVMISAVKKHEVRDSLVVRLLNTADCPVRAELKVAIPGWDFAHAYLLNLNEERQEDIGVLGDGRVQVIIGKKGLVTIELGDE